MSNYVWEVTIKWDKFALYTIGSQWVRAVDSVSANIAEGFGRYNKKDKICFYRISRASVYESLDWLEKARKRNLITDKEYGYIFKVLKALPKEINSLIKFTNNNLSI